MTRRPGHDGDNLDCAVDEGQNFQASHPTFWGNVRKKTFLFSGGLPQEPKRNRQKCTLFSKFKVTLATIMQVGCIGTIHQAAKAEKTLDLQIESLQDAHFKEFLKVGSWITPPSFCATFTHAMNFSNEVRRFLLF